MGYYDEWESGMYNEYAEPTEDQLNDWNIHNDHQDDNEDVWDDLCEWCESNGKLSFSSLCRECEDEYNRSNPHPLDIAEREELENRSEGLDLPWWREP